MKNLIFIAGLALTLALPVYAATGETTKVCVDVKDKEGKPVKDKDGKNKQQCKEMKVHKKLEGTEIPPKK
jgi:hypothetical protein